jgi:hypothetical protein
MMKESFASPSVPSKPSRLLSTECTDVMPSPQLIRRKTMNKVETIVVKEDRGVKKDESR